MLFQFSLGMFIKRYAKGLKLLFHMQLHYNKKLSIRSSRLYHHKSNYHLKGKKTNAQHKNISQQKFGGTVFTTKTRGVRVVRWCWVNFQCLSVLLIWTNVAKGPTVLAVGAGGGCLDIFSLVYHLSLLSSSL